MDFAPFVDFPLLSFVLCGLLMFAFKSNPEFLFHDSPGFESGDERQLKDVQDFIAMHAKATEVEDQLHAIWPVPQFYL